MKKLYLLTLAALVGCTSPTVVKKTSPLLPPGLKSVSRAKSPKAAEAAPAYNSAASLYFGAFSKLNQLWQL